MLLSEPLCPSNWEYEETVGYDRLLKQRNASAAAIIRGASPHDLLRHVGDPRPSPRRLFDGLTPPHFPYFAGNYRGSALRCLDTYEVKVNDDTRVGHPAATISLEMDAFQDLIRKALQECDYIHHVNSKILTKENKLFRLIELTAHAFVYFLEIHPYANGNGHMGRLILLCLLARYYIYPSNWPIHPRPAEPPYTAAIVAFRNGDKWPMISFLLRCI